MYVDPTGRFPVALFLAAVISGAIAGSVLGGVYGGVTALANGQDLGWGILIGALSGMLMGAFAGAAGFFMGPLTAGAHLISPFPAAVSFAFGLGISFVGGFAVGTFSDVAIQAVNNNGKFDWKKAFYSELQWGVLTVFSSMLSSLAEGIVDGLMVGIGSGFLISSIGLAIDVIKEHVNKPLKN